MLKSLEASDLYKTLATWYPKHRGILNTRYYMYPRLRKQVLPRQNLVPSGRFGRLGTLWIFWIWTSLGWRVNCIVWRSISSRESYI